MATCAKRGSPNGGPIDSIAPVFIKAEPQNFTTNFEENRIRIYFDEYVKLEDYQKQLIISPPLENSIISPQGVAAKYINIEIKDTLQPNTTYVFNFGQSIVDNNENNPFSYFKYIFSTGDYIDSLTVKGVIKDALKRESENFVSVMLYTIDSTYNDSTIYKQVPRYVTNTLDSLETFEITNLKEGTYALVALKDENSDFKFQSRADKVAFLDTYITVPKDTSYTLSLFKETLELKAGRPRHAAEQRINFGYAGDGDSLNIKLVSQLESPIESRITKKKDIDTLSFWFKPKVEADSLLFELSKGTFKDTLITKLRKLQADSLSFKTETGAVLVLGKAFEFSSNIPIERLDESLITIRDMDSIALPFSATLDNQRTKMTLSFDTKEDDQYRIQILPSTITDFYGNVNDTLNYNVRTRQLLDYSDIELTLINAVNHPYIIQLTNEQGRIIEEQYATEETVFTFNTLKPGNYYLQLIEDANGNKRYDTGSYLDKQQPERVIHYGRPLEASEGRLLKEQFTLINRAPSSPIDNNPEEEEE